MGNLQRAIRYKRFQVKEHSEVTLIIATQFADTLKVKVTNCSSNGLRAHTLTQLDDIEWIREGDTLLAQNYYLMAKNFL